MTQPSPEQLLAKTLLFMLLSRCKKETRRTAHLCWELAGFSSTLLVPAGNSEKEPPSEKWRQANVERSMFLEVKNMGFRVRQTWTEFNL